jgi:hypothetical protein
MIPTTTEPARPEKTQISREAIDLLSAARPVPVKRIVDFFPESEDSDKQPFLRRHAAAIIVLIIIGIAAPFVITKLVHSGNTAVKPATLVMVTVPPPPPPPQPVQTIPPEAIRDQLTFQPEEKPEEEPPKPPDQPPIGTNIKGDGSSNAFNLGSSGGNGLGTGNSNSTRFGWYAGQVQSTVSGALRNNRKTRTAELAINARIWSDQTGRVTRAQLGGSTGDPTLDSAIRDEVLTGLQLREPPPPGMPMPIVLRLSAKRPR